MIEFIATDNEVGQRTDVVVAKKLKNYSRSSLRQLFEKSFVSVNGKKVKASHIINSSDRIKIDTQLIDKQPEPIKIPILYEDNAVIVIDKPSGVLTHAKGALNLEATVASFIKPKLSDNNLSGNRAGIVHRLDRGTSGVIITAKNQAALKWLQKQFSTHKAKKIYLGVVHGKPNPEAAIIDAPIARNPRRPQTFKVAAGGKPATTKYQVLKTIKKSSSYYSLVEFEPKTGRTHQIRVHAAYIGSPIVGDHIYGHNGQTMLLHAKSLELTLPDKIRKVFEAKSPNRFKEFMANAS